MRTGLVESIEHRQDILDIFGIWVRIVKNIEERVVFGTQLFLQVIYPLGQRFSFLIVFLLNSLDRSMAALFFREWIDINVQSH